ncbi:glycosyl transferase [Pseudalgibacter alginicilyticus]|uniref:Glycosyl transferase n=2 Tax=Pseudalgibacter alginicilyticus TaxID=1736674 RepID=A0A0P0DBU3_9FLAO|nr:glycosyl transferase [Pseudalgibacter alginicilyticus]
MYNSERFISATIMSVVNQTHQNWELLLIDDFSKDKTIQIVKEFITKYPNIKLLENPANQGAAVSRNRGIKAAKGQYIAFLDADDLWKPEKLKKQLAFMKEESCDVCFSSYDLMDELGNPLNKQVKALPVLNYKKLLKSNYIGNLTGIYSVNSLGKITSPNLRKRQDWLIWLESIKTSGKPAKSIQESLAMYRVRNGSISSSKWSLLKYNYWVYKKGLGFSTSKSIFSLLVFLFEYFFIKSKQTVSINGK